MCRRYRILLASSGIHRRYLIHYAVVIEKGPTSFGAYVPDLPGCVAVGDTLDEVKTLIAEAIQFHLEGLQQDGQPIPAATSELTYVDAEVPVP
jgi:predicted RNase H-like HicB family nuclease